MKRAELVNFGSLASYRLGIDSYDSTKVGLGPLMVQMNDAGNEGKWAGPISAVTTPLRVGDVVGNTVAYPWVMRWSSSATSQLDWVFFADLSTAAATRRVYLATFDRLTQTWNHRGFVTMTFPQTGNNTVRGMRMTYDLYTVGTVAVSGTAVTGTGSTWTTDRLPVGCRIGFGSTDPTQISTWYEISAIGSNTGITLTTSAGTISAGTAYVIEDLRAILAVTNNSVANGGLVIAKGLRYELFTGVGTTISAATTVDNIRACYWLKDAASNQNQVANGLGLQARTDWQTHWCWVGNGTTTQQLFKHNLRAALTLTAGAATNQFSFATAVSATLTGTATQNNNGRVINAVSGPGAGVECYYFTTATRIYRTKSLNSLVASDSTFITGGDLMTPAWPNGNTNTFASPPSTMQNIEYAASMDFLVVSNVASGTNKLVLTKYKTDGTPAERMALSNEHGPFTPTNTAIAANGLAEPIVSASGVWVEDGLLYTVYTGGTASGGIFAVPIGADWEYAATSGSRVITPSISLPDADKITKVVTQFTQSIGLNTGYNMASPTNPARLLYRTGGISDNTGSWTSVDQSGTINAAGATSIQFAVEFRTIGVTAATARLHSLAVIYEDTNTLSNYQFSVTESSATLKQFSWRHATAFGSTVPALRVRLYDAVTGSLLVDDNTSSPTGTWERSTDGTTYSAWTNTDKTNETTYVRYTPASIADSIQVRATLTLL